MKASIKKRLKQDHCPACPPWKRSDLDACHIRSKGAGGCDDDFNLLAMCREHHIMQHKLGWWTYTRHFPAVMERLKEKGWEWNDVLGVMKLWHQNLAIEKKDSCI